MTGDRRQQPGNDARRASHTTALLRVGCHHEAIDYVLPRGLTAGVCGSRPDIREPSRDQVAPTCDRVGVVKDKHRHPRESEGSLLVLRKRAHEPNERIDTVRLPDGQRDPRIDLACPCAWIWPPRTDTRPPGSAWASALATLQFRSAGRVTADGLARSVREPARSLRARPGALRSPSPAAPQLRRLAL